MNWAAKNELFFFIFNKFLKEEKIIVTVICVEFKQKANIARFLVIKINNVCDSMIEVILDAIEVISQLFSFVFFSDFKAAYTID